MTKASPALLADVDPSSVFAWHDGQAVTRAAFRRDIERVADQLPERSYTANYCRQRYSFAVAFVAAMLRGQVTLLPHDGTERTSALLRRRYPDFSNLTDEPERADLDDTVLVDVRGNADGTARALPAIPADRVVAIAFTSGTTGVPTPHEKTFRALRGCAELYVHELDLPADGGSVVATVPPQHMYGLEASILVPLFTSMALHSGHPLYPHDVRAALREVSAPRVLATTPIHLRALAGSMEDLPPTDIIISAAAPLAPALAHQAESRFGARVLEVYGCTEAGIVATRHTTISETWTLPNVVTMTTHGDTSWVESEHAGRTALHDDVERISEREFRLHGRGADLINVAGKRASLAGLDAILLEIDGILDGGFFLAANQDDRESRLSVVVVAPRLTATDIKRQLRTRVDAAFMPRDVHLVETLPRDQTGKLPRASLGEVAQPRRASNRDA